MHKRSELPPIQATARLVTLYESGISVGAWPIAQPDDETLVPIIRAHYERLQAALSVAYEARRFMDAPLAPTAAAVYLLVASGISLEDTRRLLAPATDETIEGDDPRAALRRVMRSHAASVEVHHEHETLAFILRAWNLWAAGSTPRRLAWRPHEGMPSITRWAADIPLPPQPVN